MNTNDKVTGTYYGVKFSGTITSIRPDYSGIRMADVITVKLDEAIKTPSDKRDVIMITAAGNIGITSQTTIYKI